MKKIKQFDSFLNMELVNKGWQQISNFYINRNIENLCGIISVVWYEYIFH